MLIGPWSTLPLLLHSESIVGKIEKCDSVNTDNGMEYSYIGMFQIHNTPYEFHNDLIGRQRFKVGQFVSVLYNPKNPNENVINTFGDKYASVFGILIMVFQLILNWVLHRRYYNRKKIASL